MWPDDALAIYHAGPEVVVKTLCGFCDTIGSLENRINLLENKIAKLSKNSSNSSKPPSSDDITKPNNKKNKKEQKRKIGGQPGHERHVRPPFSEDEIDKTHPYILTGCPVCEGDVRMLDAPPRIIQQMELPEVPIIKEDHRSYPVWCEKCQQIHYMPFPANVVKEGLFKETLAVKEGYLDIPDKPGLGVEIREGLAEQYPYIPGPWNTPGWPRSC